MGGRAECHVYADMGGRTHICASRNLGGWSNQLLCHSRLELKLNWAVTIVTLSVTKQNPFSATAKGRARTFLGPKHYVPWDKVFSPCPCLERASHLLVCNEDTVSLLHSQPDTNTLGTLIKLAGKNCWPIVWLGQS